MTPAQLGEAGVESAVERGRGCVKPVRLRGSRHLVNTETGELTKVYSSADELDGITYVKCGNRRAAVCPTCSHEYKGDAWHLFMCGLAGGKGIPESVALHPCTFATLTAPSFGPVHGLSGRRGPAVLGATSRCASTVARCGATSGIGTTTRASASRCARTATTTSRTWSGSGTRRSSGGASASPCSAHWRRSAA